MVENTGLAVVALVFIKVLIAGMAISSDSGDSSGGGISIARNEERGCRGGGVGCSFNNPKRYVS